MKQIKTLLIITLMLSTVLIAVNFMLWINMNDIIKSHDERLDSEYEKLKYIQLDKHWNEMNQKMKESAE